MTVRKQALALGAIVAASALPGASNPGAAQHVAPPPPAAYALENVTVFHADGREEVGVNIVIRRGFILAMGPGVPIPPDAQILEGDSLRVYPGFVDAQGKAALELPEVENRQAVLPWAPPREAQGFTPHRLAADFLVGFGPDGKEARTAGVVAAGIHPEGGMAPGQSAVVIFRTDAGSPSETVGRPSVGLSFSFQGARGVYPGTLFGVIAHFRQMFEDAAREGLIQTEYAQSPIGLHLPKWDPDLEALRSATSGRLPVFFTANSAGDIRRVLGLADEIGFRPIIVGGEEAWRVAEELSSRGVPVLASVDFSRPTEWEPPEKPDEGAEPTEEPTESEPLEPGAAREKERLEHAYANAARLVGAGVTVALTSGGKGGDFREGVAKAVEYGLSEGDALSAVTTVPASILGIPNVVTVAQGMAANFIVTDGPVFGEDTGILYTFVEGGLEKGTAGGGGGGSGEAPTVDVTGGWDVVVMAEGMEMPFRMTLTQEGDSFSGSMTSAEAGEAEVAGGTVSGSELTFTLVFSMGTESMELSAKATVEGDTMSGSGSGQMGSFTFRATRDPGTEGGAR
jgi:hypothetical protein